MSRYGLTNLYRLVLMHPYSDWHDWPPPPRSILARREYTGVPLPYIRHATL